MSKDPISFAGFHYGLVLCESEYVVAYKLATLYDVQDPRKLRDFKKATIALATACWHHRVDHRRLIQAIVDVARQGEFLTPESVIRLAGREAEKLSDRPWLRNEVSAKLESELLYVKMLMNGLRKNEDEADMDVFIRASEENQIRADLLYVLATINGCGQVASRVLPAAVWSLRVHPLRQRILSEMMTQKTGGTHAT